MTTCSLELKFALCCKWGNCYSQFTTNKLSIQTKLSIVLYKLAQLVKIVLV